MEGTDPETPTATTPPKARSKKAAVVQEDAGPEESDTALTAESDEDEDGPLLVEEDEDDAETTDEDDDDAEDASAEDAAQTQSQKATLKKLFQAREAKRQLKTQLEDATKQTEELKSKLASLTSGLTTAAVQFDGVFRNDKTLEDLNKSADWLEQRAAFLEDNDEGFTEVDSVTNEEVDRDPKWIKQQLRAVRNELKRVPQLTAALESNLQRQTQSTEKAKKAYPFVFDTSSKRHALVLDLIKEHPELQSSPARSLLLGRLALAKLVEDKEYVLVPKSKLTAAPTAQPAHGKATAAPAVRREVARESAASPALAPTAPRRAAVETPRVISSRSNDALQWMESIVG